MKTYEFSLVASGLNPQAPDFESRFYDQGCEDATVSFQRGYIIVDFAREADSLEEAIASATENVIAAGCRVERVEPDPLVSLAEIAARTNMSRAAMTQYSKGQRGKDFPPPTARITSENPLWAWADVAKWLFRNKKITKEQVIEAEVVRQVNDVLASGQQHVSITLSARVNARVHELEDCA